MALSLWHLHLKPFSNPGENDLEAGSLVFLMIIAVLALRFALHCQVADDGF